MQKITEEMRNMTNFVGDGRNAYFWSIYNFIVFQKDHPVGRARTSMWYFLIKLDLESIGSSLEID